MSKKIIKQTKYCNILEQVKIADNEYTYTVEKIYIKALRRKELRFCVYKCTRRGDETYIPRSLDVTEEEFQELIVQALRTNMFSKEFIKVIKEELIKE
ncbi:hypothetical protein DVV91_12360 [Clostridium botulinum]|uniref:hypothetical protein n=1 Tax=Clostridium botulinum TaxID=1491 RepID=UPI000174E6E5|nr:hypothetical protein [Clostridium botulinum]ACD52779.1 conserved hypothetical protein [Clostridium botulinum E3 str. Alaska E43]AJF30329.1 hypothetical protein ST13_11695 [Clostridium botulinum]AJF33392.1 hypothetical protein ST12_11695 [Clostridium botulinum]MBN1049412.1 hypothetical protein [Clostridium botulinum]MBN1075132.1 hypothetical protein [Clostridium botulinum]